MALSHLLKNKDASEEELAHFVSQISSCADQKSVSVVRQQIEKSLNSPLTSSCGRLFDAVSSLLGVCHKANYEGQAAIELEALALSYAKESEPTIYNRELEPFSYKLQKGGELTHIEPSEMLHEMMAQLQAGSSRAYLAAKFHRTVADMILKMCCRLRDEAGISDICLSGGVFQNQLLLQYALALLQSANFRVFFPQRLPANDGGLSLGQAAVALAKENAVVFKGAASCA
jgi:hydrogenase maturation protein HypF